MDASPAKAQTAGQGLAGMLARCGLVATGLIAWRSASALWEGGTTPTQTYATLLMLAAYLGGFLLLVAAATELRRQHLATWLIPPVLMIVTLCHLQDHHVAQLENGPVTTDVHIYMDYAARLLRRGVNPYTEDLLEAYRLHRMPFTFSTPLIDGDITGRVAYPALSFLLFVPVQALGLPTRAVYFWILVLTLALLFAKAPRRWRPLALVPFFVDSRFLLYTLGGVSDCVWAALLCLMVWQWRNRHARGIWFGLALAFKHQPWFVAPFLLIRIIHETSGDRRARLRELATFGLLSAAVFLLINGPFILWSPSDWLAGVCEPLRTPMITFGQGLSALTMSGIVSIPRWFYSVMMVGVLGGGLVLCGYYYPRARYVMWLAPGVALWFGNRSLSSYWYFYLLPLMADLLCTQGGRGFVAGLTRFSRRPLWAVAGGLGLIAIVALATVSNRKRSLSVAVLNPLRTMDGYVVGMDVAVANRSERPVVVRLAVQSGGLQPYFWIIERGPSPLAAGERGVYRIRAGAPFERFRIRRGARVIVSSADGTHPPTSALVRGDVRDAYRDAVTNGDFRYWDARQDNPAFWGVVAAPPGGGRVRPGSPSGPGAPSTSVLLELDPVPPGAGPRHVLLDTYMVLPRQPVTVWVRVPENANLLPDPQVAYGLRVVAGRRQAWVLFGDETVGGWLPGGVPYRMLQAPRESWSQLRVDLRKVLVELGAELLPLFGRQPGLLDVDYPVVAANLQLMLWARTSAVRLSAEFGPVRTERRQPDPQELFVESRTFPEIASLWRGDLAFTYGNYEKARRHYVAAKRFLPDEALVPLRLAEAERRQGRWERALEAYRAALELDPRNPVAYQGAGWCYYRLDRIDEAVDAWRTALRFLLSQGRAADPANLADTLKGLGLAVIRQGYCREGETYLSQARAAMPSVDIDPADVAECEAAQDDVEEATVDDDTP